MNPDGRLTWNHDDAEGGVTCAVIEKEVECTSCTEGSANGRDARVLLGLAPMASTAALLGTIATLRARAEEAEVALADVHERDETVARLEQRLTEAEYHRYSWKSAALRAEQPRPLTADDLDYEAYRRAREAFTEATGVATDDSFFANAINSAVTAALTEPQRPDGAEELARLIATADVGEWDCGDLADALLATGRVRVVTEEDR